MHMYGKLDVFPFFGLCIVWVGNIMTPVLSFQELSYKNLVIFESHLRWTPYHHLVQ